MVHASHLAALAAADDSRALVERVRSMERGDELATFHFHAALFARAAAALTARPPAVGLVTPSTIRRGSTDPIMLLPPKGQPFPVEAPGFWRPALFGSGRFHLLTVLSWSPTQVKVRLPDDAPAGGLVLGWLVPLKKHLDRVDPKLAARAFELLEAPALLPWVPHRARALTLSVVGAPVIRSFQADGQTPTLVAEAGAEITLEWDVALELGHRAEASARVSLWAGDAPIADVPLQGSLAVSERESVAYRLRAESWVEGERCGEAEQALTVERYQAVQVRAGDRWFDRGAPVAITVALSSPAPAGGVAVTLASSHPTRLASRAVTIAEGRREAAVELAAGDEHGEVVLTASAPGHRRAELRLVIAGAPEVLSLSPPVVDACTPATLSIVGRGLGREPAEHTVTLTCAGASRVESPARVEHDARDPFGHPTVLLVELPPLEPGEYAVSIGFRGRAGQASTKLLVLDQRPVIDRFAATGGSAVALAWSVRHARRIRLLRGDIELRELVRANDSKAWEGTLAVSDAERHNMRYTLEAWSPSGHAAATATTEVERRRAF
jgi:hypothetical protein